MSDAVPERVSPEQAALSAQPISPPKTAARSQEETRSDRPRKTFYLPELVAVRDLASAVGVKPHRIVADLLAMSLFKNVDNDIDFETAATIARKHGCRAERPPPGMLVL